MIFLDPASVHAEMCRRHPEIDPNRVSVAVNASASGPMFKLHDTTGLADGIEVEASDPIIESYHGLSVGIVCWKKKRRRGRR